MGLFSFLSYLTIIISTYSLVSKFFRDEKLGVKTAFIIASLTELVLQATSTKNDIPMAAIVVVCFLSSYAFLKTGNSFHLYMTFTALLWGVSVKGYFPGFGMPFALLLLWILLKEYRFKPILKILFQKRTLNFALLLPLGLIICLSAFYGNNLMKFKSIWGPKNYVRHHQNKDGLYGGVCNIGRYFVQFIDFPKPLIQNNQNKLYERVFGRNNQWGVADKNTSADLFGKTALSEDYSWYGPLGILLVFPSILISCFSRRRFLRMVAFSLLIFMIILSNRIGWTPWSTRFFSLFFAGSGVCLAFVLHEYARHKGAHFLIVAVSFLTIFSATLLNQSKSAIRGQKIGSATRYLYQVTQELIEGKPKSSPILFPWVVFLADRDTYYKNYYGAAAFEKYSTSIEQNRNVLLVGTHIWIFPLLFKRPDLHFTVAKPHKVILKKNLYNMNNENQYHRISERYDYLVVCGEQLPEMQMQDFLKKEQLIFKQGSGRNQLSLYRIK